MTFWRETASGLVVTVKVQPRSRRPGVQGRSPTAGGEALKLGVAQPPEDGRANRAVCDMLAALLDVPDGAVEVIQGATSRLKQVRVTGDPAFLAARLAAL